MFFALRSPATIVGIREFGWKTHLFFCNDRLRAIIARYHQKSVFGIFDVDADSVGSDDGNWTLGMLDDWTDYNGSFTSPTVRSVMMVGYKSWDEDFPRRWKKGFGDAGDINGLRAEWVQHIPSRLGGRYLRGVVGELVKELSWREHCLQHQRHAKRKCFFIWPRWRLGGSTGDSAEL